MSSRADAGARRVGGLPGILPGMHAAVTAAILAMAALLPAPALTGSLAADTASQRALEFDVYLDGSKIGWHRFDISPTAAGGREVRSEASFDVKFLFITAYRYRHDNNERWKGGCLSRIRAETNANGKRTSISGVRRGEAFVVETGGTQAELPACVMTFAYWNPAFLQQQRLLNPQTGEYLEVDVERQETETLQVDGRPVEATPYALRARGMEVTVWYSPDDRWLALESVTKGRTIRYELS